MGEQERRKSKSQNLLKKLGSDFLPSLPIIESEEETNVRASRQVGSRILCLVCVAAAADGLERKKIVSWLKKESLFFELTQQEKTFLEKTGITDKERIKFSWLSECIWLLLWAAKKVDRNLPTEQCIVNEILEKIPAFGSSTSEFMNSIELRNKADILDMSDFLFRAHWATRQNGVDGKTKIGKLNPDVVQEWHHAINWLTCCDDVDNWDKITTDT
jgi:hypothetical protein